MTQLTLGQRIAVRRKLLGLSQEALADLITVSRQAVSKWESDATIPEIDNLIALAKLYEVNIGWLLGIETEVSSPAGFNDDQFKTIEELISRYQPSKKFAWLKIFACICLILVATVLVIYYNCQLHVLNSSNQEAAAQISILTEDNQTLQQQISDMNKLLTQQREDNRLLTEFFKIRAYADDGLKNVTVRLYMKPKVYLENNTACLSIQNPNINYSASVSCTWDEYNQVYIANYTIPAIDGYNISFLLINEHGYEEENLLLRDPDFGKMGTFCSFYMDPTNSQSTRMQRKEPLYLRDDALAVYTFNIPIYTPHIFAEHAVAYKDIRIMMKHNGKIIWEKSYKDAFYAAAGGVTLNARDNPVWPRIEIYSLNDLVESGDELELVLTAETVNGGKKTQTYYTLLDYIRII